MSQMQSMAGSRPGAQSNIALVFGWLYNFFSRRIER